MSLFNRFFHKCKFKIIETPFSNKNGEIWIEQCKCGKKQKVVFDKEGYCRDITKSEDIVTLEYVGKTSFGIQKGITMKLSRTSWEKSKNNLKFWKEIKK